MRTIFLIYFLLALILPSAAHAAVLFSENFGTGFDWTTSLPAGWSASNDSTSGMDDMFSITGAGDGNRYAWIQGLGGTNDQNIARPSISTTGFQNIIINYSYNLMGSFSATDFLVAEWKKSSDSSYTLIQKVTGISGWNSVSFNLPSSASNTNIDIRFRADDTETNDFILIDNVAIEGVLASNCGNNVLDQGEHCDDGNLNNNDGCSSTCTLTFCGDGIIQQPNGLGTAGPSNDGNEECDDGDLDNNDACSNNCELPEPVCGNNVIEAGEECDDGNTANGDGCDSNCQSEGVCGNSIIEIGEECDDGNIANGDGCDSNCQIEVICGNNIVQEGEECDDGNTLNGDGCNSNCLREVCGDGVTQLLLGEQCDDANFNNHDNCLNSCNNPSCGDGFLHVGFEQCDDGNIANGDGCNATCKFEPSGKCLAPVDVMLVVDRSGSMNQLDGVNTRLKNAKTAALAFINATNFSKDEVGLASFNESATLDQSLTGSNVTIINKINALKAGGQTNIGDGLKLAREELILNGGATKALVLLSDGAPNAMTQNGSIRFCFVNPTSPTNCTIYAVNQSNITKAAGIEIFTIGLGVNNFTENLLKEIATIPSNYFSAPNSSQLKNIYLQIAQEICPCQGFNCGINTDQCNVGVCNLQTDQCEFQQEPLSTSCEEDSTKCTTQHCDGTGACVVNDTVDVPAPEACKSFYCDSNDGLVKENLTQFPLSTPCNTDQDLCTIQHCNGNGQCVINDTVDVPPPEQCKSFFCDPVDGQIKQNNSGFPESTPCEADENLCTIDHCDGQGTCVQESLKDCSNLDGQCQQGTCNPQNGLCEPDFSSFPLSTPCNADENLCTLDHCNGFGTCQNFGNVFVPPPEQCKSFFCDPVDGQVKPSPFQLSTPCVTDDNICTVEHCNGNGQCVINPDAELPPECKSDIIKDSKVAQALPTSNFGLGKYMIVNPKKGAIDRSYLRVDTSPLNSNVTSANLKIAVYQTGGNATGSAIQAYYCRNHDFIETTINWNNQPLDSSCSLADTFIVPNDVIGGEPETFHIFNLTNETNFEINNGDGLFTIVLRSALENTGITHNRKHVQYITKEYDDANFRPKFLVS